MNVEDIKKALEITIKPYLAISVTKQLDNISQPQSKFGGLPYLPYPKASNGDYLYLLAQINFAEVPELEGFPQKGILQFYIANDDLYGLNFENQFAQEGFRVLYFPNSDMESLMTDFSFLPLHNADYLPLSLNIGEERLALSFTRQSAPISLSDYKFENFAGDELRDFIYDTENLFNEHSGYGHKIGGYPCFTQSDPREFLPDREQTYILLLQIDSDEDILWGDVGVSNFFHKESDLKNLDFTNIMYNWDCH